MVGGDEQTLYNIKKQKRRPSIGDQVSFTVRRAVAKNCPGPGYVQQDAAFERYTLGSRVCCRGVELALETMREGESASFNVRVRHLPKDVSVYPEDITITLSKIHQDVILSTGGGGGGGGGEGDSSKSNTAAAIPGGSGFVLVKRRTRWGSAKTDGSTANSNISALTATAVGAQGGRVEVVPISVRDDAGRVVAREGCEVTLTFGDVPSISLGGGGGGGGSNLAEALPRRFVIRSSDDKESEGGGGGGEGGMGKGVAEALESAVMLSSAGERFELTMAPAVYGYADVDQSAPSDEAAFVAAAKQDAPPVICLDITVDTVSPPTGTQDISSLSPATRLSRAGAAKERGVQLYKRGRLRAALRRYEDALTLLTLPFASETAADNPLIQGGGGGVDPWSSNVSGGEGVGSLKDERGVLMNATLLNAALAASKRGDHRGCEGYCTKVLERRPGGDDCNVKALFRRGRARVAMERWDEADDDLARAERLDSTLAREVAVERRRIKQGRARGDASMKAAFKKIFGGGGGGSGSGSGSGQRETYTAVAEITAGPGMTAEMASAEMAALDLVAAAEGGDGSAADGITDEKDPRVIADHAVNRAVKQEMENEAAFAASGIPFELYTDAERAPVGAAFPMSGAVTNVVAAPEDFAEIEREIAEEEEEERKKREVQAAVARGQAMRRVGVTTNPWDPDGKKAEREMDEHFRREYEEGQRKLREEEAAAHREKMRKKTQTVGADTLDVE